ncbi:MAG: hypothetical protein ABSA75_12025 [Candidatus Bathyarchaeia archaeon]
MPPKQVKEKFRGVFEGTDSWETAKIDEKLATGKNSISLLKPLLFGE